MDQIQIGNFSKGLTTNRNVFNIDNDAFPFMFNFYSWRGRAKRKRGTQLVAQLERTVAADPHPLEVWQNAPLQLAGGSANMINAFSLQPTSSITPGSISMSLGVELYTDTAEDGTLSGDMGGSGTINYATGEITITGGGAGVLVGNVNYYPGDPVMGLRDFLNSLTVSSFPELVAFDTDYSYQLSQSSSPYNFYNVNFYKNSQQPFQWRGADYQQFWTANFQGALWATNNNPGFHFVTASYNSGSGTAVINFTFTKSGAPFEQLEVDDYVWINEFGSDIDGRTGQITAIINQATGQYAVTFSSTVTVSGTGIAQLLTSSINGRLTGENASLSGSEDGIRWYDGDPTGGTGIPSSTGLGWVNFAPPLTETNVSINDKTLGKYYLVGAQAIVPFKDRLLFFSPWIRTSAGTQFNLIDTVIWSWNGTPYYTDLTPSGETSDVSAYYVDQTGKGGYQSAGISQSIKTVTSNEDVLLVGFTGRQTRLVYTGNDLFPFQFFNINTELGSSSTFSGISLDQGGLYIGAFGIAMVDQQSAQRIDLEIPNLVFQIKETNNGVERINAIRDFTNEWVYFSYPYDSSEWRFPVRSFLYNYRDVTWSVLYENFTSHGQVFLTNSYTWATLPYKTWATWNVPWSAGSSNSLFPSIIGGNPQGYVMIKGLGTGESVSGTIVSVSSASGKSQIESFDHCVHVGDFLYFSGALGLSAFNTLIGKVIDVIDENNFVVDIDFPSGAYLGLGKFTRLSQPLLKTKQFPLYWEQGRKVRLSSQQYLLDRTANAQATINLYLSQDSDSIWNKGPVVPSEAPDPTNNSLIYSQLIYTCNESGNIGLTAPNTNLQMSTGSSQDQIWHRFNTSLIGDTVQIGLTLNEEQMKNLTYATSELVLSGMNLNVSPGPLLA